MNKINNNECKYSAKVQGNASGVKALVAILKNNDTVIKLYGNIQEKFKLYKLEDSNMYDSIAIFEGVCLYSIKDGLMENGKIHVEHRRNPFNASLEQVVNELNLYLDIKSFDEDGSVHERHEIKGNRVLARYESDLREYL